MKYIYLLTFLLLGSFCQAQETQESFQYNIIFDESTSSDSFTFEIVNLEDRSKSIIADDFDSFVNYLFSDLESLPKNKRQVLFYIHGMWGGKSFAFNRTYKLMESLYLENNNSDVARIVSLKWPGNKMEYKVNKDKLYEIDGQVAQMFESFVSAFYVHRYFKNLPDVNLDMIAHSLGTELIKEVLCQLPIHNYKSPIIDQLILASPDLSTDVFEVDDCFGSNLCMVKNTTVYYSERDLTLGVSKNLNKIDRLGRVGPSQDSNIPTNVSFVNIAQIKDETNFSDLMTGHSSFRASPIVAQDILSVLMGDEKLRFTERILLSDAKNIFMLEPIAK